MAGLARLLAPTLDLPNHVQRLEAPREPPLEEDEPALAQLRGDIDALGDEPFDNGLAPVVDDTDAPLAALEAGANVGSDHRHFLLAPVVQGASVVRRAELLDCRAHFFEVILGVHGLFGPAGNLDPGARALSPLRMGPERGAARPGAPPHRGDAVAPPLRPLPPANESHPV